jgi:hypothetical protein
MYIDKGPQPIYLVKSRLKTACRDTLEDFFAADGGLAGGLGRSDLEAGVVLP